MPLPELFERTRRRLDPILPEPPAMPADVLAALPGVGKTLPFTMQTQKLENWCWAAVSVSVAKFYQGQSPWRQCLLVNDQLGLANCCPNGSPAECDQPWFLERGLDRVGHLARKEEASVAFQTVSDEIDNRRPLGCFIVWPQGPGHFVILNGYSTDFGANPPRAWVSVEDPKYGHSDYTYLKFLISYRKVGEWRFSYFTQP
jgi:hypothetical protein